MMWQDTWNGWGWAGWCAMFGTVIVLVGLGVWLVASLVSRNESVGSAGTAADILAQRFARGELEEDNYRRESDLVRDR